MKHSQNPSEYIIKCCVVIFMQMSCSSLMYPQLVVCHLEVKTHSEKKYNTIGLRFNDILIASCQVLCSQHMISL